MVYLLLFWDQHKANSRPGNEGLSGQRASERLFSQILFQSQTLQTISFLAGVTDHWLTSFGLHAQGFDLVFVTACNLLSALSWDRTLISGVSRGKHHCYYCSLKLLHFPVKNSFLIVWKIPQIAQFELRRCTVFTRRAKFAFEFVWKFTIKYFDAKKNHRIYVFFTDIIQNDHRFMADQY